MNEIDKVFSINRILEAVKLRLRFDNSGEFEKALLELLKDQDWTNELLGD